MKNNYPKWALKYKRKGTAIHKIGNNYYLYEIASKWDPEIGRAKKITKGYLGVIRQDGIKEPRYRSNRPTTIKEYGASLFLMEDNRKIIEKLKEYFFDCWKEIFILSVFRLMYQSPLKHMQLHYLDSWLCQEMPDARLSKDSLGQLLETIGAQRESIVEFLRGFIGGSEKLLIDLTHVFSLSDNMILAEKGYNSELDFTPQVNLLFIFSVDKKLPLFYRILPGNVRDVASLKATIKESQIEEIIIIADKGFYSENNITLLEKNKLQYILPLKRNNTLIEYKVLEEGTRASFDGYFKFRDRYIWHYRCGKELSIWVFLDDELHVKEQKDYLQRIETHPELGYTIENFIEKQHTFGTISLISNLKSISPEKIFHYFKSRIGIEQMFDSFKNVLEADRTYMRNDYSMEGWMFINYLSLMYYYKIYHRLIENDLLSKYTPLDVLLYLSKYRKVKISTHWLELEIPKQTRMLMEKLNLPIT